MRFLKGEFIIRSKSRPSMYGHVVYVTSYTVLISGTRPLGHSASGRCGGHFARTLCESKTINIHDSLDHSMDRTITILANQNLVPIYLNQNDQSDVQIKQPITLRFSNLQLQDSFEIAPTCVANQVNLDFKQTRQTGSNLDGG